MSMRTWNVIVGFLVTVLLICNLVGDLLYGSINHTTHQNICDVASIAYFFLKPVCITTYNTHNEKRKHTNAQLRELPPSQFLCTYH